MYSLSPVARRGLNELARNDAWGCDYDRCLRFLEAAVSAGEAVVITEAESRNVRERDDWQRLEVGVCFPPYRMARR